MLGNIFTRLQMEQDFVKKNKFFLLTVLYVDCISITTQYIYIYACKISGQSNQVESRLARFDLFKLTNIAC